MVLLFPLLVLGGCSQLQLLLMPDESDLVTTLDAEVMALKSLNTQLEAAAENCGSDDAPHAIYAELHQVFSGTTVQVSRDGSDTIVDLTGADLFLPGSVQLAPSSEMSLDMISTALHSHPEVHAQITGHTDDQPIGGGMTYLYPSNWELSTARAGVYARALIDRFEVDPAQLTVSGRGHHEPIADNETTEGRAANRRVVVRFTSTSTP